MSLHNVLIAGEWRDAASTDSFSAVNPISTEELPGKYPTSSWSDINKALDSAQSAFLEMRNTSPERIAKFLERYADRIEARSEEIRQLAHLETALPFDTRLKGETGRTTGQLRQAAKAAREGSWAHAVIDTDSNIRSCYSAIGPVAVFGPNNFPLAFGSVSGGDFAAAIAAGNPVIAKAHPLHPGTTRLLAEEAQEAANETGMPKGIVQLLYNMSYSDGERMVRDPRLASVGFTGSKRGGLALKKAADELGKPVYLEMSSVNPVVILPSALKERGEEIAEELLGSCLMGTGQFCTNPGLIILEKNENTSKFVASIAEKFAASPSGTLFSAAGRDGLKDAIDILKNAGAEEIARAEAGDGFSYPNTVLKVSGAGFLEDPESLQQEAFGNATLIVEVDSDDQAIEVIQSLEGNLTGCIYSARDGGDDSRYDKIEPHLRERVGRLINDKMPTGVAVTAAMNHGGPFPATGHSGFSSVGIPGSLRRFSMLQCYDNVRSHRLPPLLKNENSRGAWRQVDGAWTQASIN